MDWYEKNWGCRLIMHLINTFLYLLWHPESFERWCKISSRISTWRYCICKESSWSISWWWWCISRRLRGLFSSISWCYFKYRFILYIIHWHWNRCCGDRQINNGVIFRCHNTTCFSLYLIFPRRILYRNHWHIYIHFSFIPINNEEYIWCNNTTSFIFPLRLTTFLRCLIFQLLLVPILLLFIKFEHWFLLFFMY